MVLEDKELSYCHKWKLASGKPRSSRMSKNTDCFFLKLHKYWHFKKPSNFFFGISLQNLITEPPKSAV